MKYQQPSHVTITERRTAGVGPSLFDQECGVLISTSDVLTIINLLDRVGPQSQPNPMQLYRLRSRLHSMLNEASND